MTGNQWRQRSVRHGMAAIGAAALIACCGMLGGPTELGPEYGPASWRLDPDHMPPGPESGEVHILVEEYACSNGSSAEGRVSQPIVDYGRSQVTITVGVRPIQVPSGEGINCQGNPELPMTVHLQQPLGRRLLVDSNARPAG